MCFRNNTLAKEVDIARLPPVQYFECICSVLFRKIYTMGLAVGSRIISDDMNRLQPSIRQTLKCDDYRSILRKMKLKNIYYCGPSISFLIKAYLKP